MIRISKSFDDRTTKVLKIASKYKGARKFLDIGCGADDFTILLKNVLLAPEAHSIDISIETCTHLREQGIQALCLNLNEIKTLPYEDEYFDAIFCGELVEHLIDPDNLLSEIHRILKRGGIAIMTTPNLGAWYNRLILLFGFQPHLFPASPRNSQVGQFLYYRQSKEGGDHIRAMTARAFKELIEIHDFKIIKFVGSYGKIKAFSPGLKVSAYKTVNKMFCVFPTLSAIPIALFERRDS